MKKIRVIIALVFLFAGITAKSQVTVAPVSIHLSDANKNGYLLVRNSSPNSAWEVSIDMKFGYPFNDTAGNIQIYFPDEVKPGDPSAVGWVSFFPRKFILKPQEEQTVRISAKPPKDLKDGEYWGRPVISSQAQSKLDTVNNQELGIGLSVKFQTIIALNFRKGKTSTGIKLKSLNAIYEEGKAVIQANMEREGNSAYLGMIIAKIYNSSNDLIKESENEFAVYYTLSKKITFDIPGLPKGEYMAEVELNTNRSEPGGTILKGNTVKKNVRFTVN